jgi:hypothetical protein
MFSRQDKVKENIAGSQRIYLGDAETPKIQEAGGRFLGT